MNDEFDYKLYVLTEIYYMRKHPNLSDEELFPKDWYDTKDYKQKIEIMDEAMENKCLIKDTPKYREMKLCIK